jgi:hypothetical protein
MLLEDLDLADADVSRSDIFGVASGANDFIYHTLA